MSRVELKESVQDGISVIIRVSLITKDMQHSNIHPEERKQMNLEAQ